MNDSNERKFHLKGVKWPMDREAKELINDCIHLQREISQVAPIIFFLSSSHNVKEAINHRISNVDPSKIRLKFKQFGSSTKIKIEYLRNLREFENKLADLAELLEEEEFEIDRLRSRLSENQFNWLVSHKKEIKNRLRGIELGERKELRW